MIKVMSKMINSRHIWYLEKNKIIHKEQSGFRHTRSIIYNLYVIKSKIDCALENNQSLGMICLDITIAYDSIRRYRVLTILSQILTNGNIISYI